MKETVKSVPEWIIQRANRIPKMTGWPLFVCERYHALRQAYGDRSAIGALYADWIGYDCFEDDPEMPTHEGFIILCECIGEELRERGIWFPDELRAMMNRAHKESGR